MDEKVLSHKIVSRDVQVVQLLANGKSMREICEITGDNQNTIEMRMYRLRKNLGLKSSAHLTAYFVRNGIIE